MDNIFTILDNVATRYSDGLQYTCQDLSDLVVYGDFYLVTCGNYYHIVDLDMQYVDALEISTTLVPDPSLISLSSIVSSSSLLSTQHSDLFYLHLFFLTLIAGVAGLLFLRTRM